jgi:NAD(P)-dependent dehydrogenase (short-subunit alcohol dehydrogenase family)
MLVGRKQERLDAAASAIRGRGGVAATHATDVRDYAGVAAAMQATRVQFGEIDILVCGAAGNFPASVLGMSANGFKAVIDIDLIGTFNTCRAAHEHLRKPGASVLAISASFAFQPTALQSHVGAGKAGVEILIKTLAIEWGADRIRCNCITPGATDDTEGMRRLAPDAVSRERTMSAVPLGRFGTKDELADLALFLCSDAASYITGAIYVCDGGLSLARSGFSLRAVE